MPDTEIPPRPGSELVAELRHTATHFDRVAMFGEEVVGDQRAWRQGTTGVSPAACAESVSSS
jgi:hypothetical protein